MAGRVLGVVADDERRPGRVLRGGRVPVGVGPLDRVGRAPEGVVVLRLPARDHRVRGRNPRVAEQPGGLAQIEAPGVRQRTQRAAVLDERLIGEEANRLGLQRRPRRSRGASVRLQLLQITRVALARDLDRSTGPPLGLRAEGERPHSAQLDVDRRRRRDRLEHTHARRLLDVRNHVVEVIAGPHRQHPRGRGSAGRLARVLRRPVRNRRHVGVVGDLNIRRLGRHAGNEDVPSRPARRLRPPTHPEQRSHPVANGSRPPSTDATAS